ELAAHLEHQQLVAGIEIGDQDALAWKYRDQPFAGEPLQRFAHRRAAELVGGRQHLLGHELAGLEAQRDDLLLDDAIGLLGQSLRRLRTLRRGVGSERRPGLRGTVGAVAASHVQGRLAWETGVRRSATRASVSRCLRRLIYVSYVTGHALPV